MIDKKTVKYLENQKECSFTFELINKLDLTYELIKNIGDRDSYLRDDVIYPSLAHLLHDKHLSHEHLIEITKELIGDSYLSYDMDNLEEYGTLKRTFTSLQLAMLVYVHNRDTIFSKEFMIEIFNNILDYYINETDLRGYDPTVGWIHSIAHGADLFAQLVKCEEIEVRDFERLLEAISLKFKINTYSYVSDEDERTVNAIFNLLERDIISNEYMVEWVNILGEYDRPKTYPEVYRINSNVKNLLRSLYFRVLDNEKYRYLSLEIKKVLIEKVKLR